VRLRAVVAGRPVSGSFHWRCNSEKVRLEFDRERATVALLQPLDEGESVKVTCTLSAAGRDYEAEHNMNQQLRFFVPVPDQSGHQWTEHSQDGWQRHTPNDA